MLVMTIAVYFYLPETKGVPLESMGEVWANHWYWWRWCLREDMSQRFQETMSTPVDNCPSLEEL